MLRNIYAREIASLICENLIDVFKQLLTLHKLTPTSDATSEHIDGSRFHTVAVWSHIVLIFHYNNVIYKESHVYNSKTR